MLLILKDLKKHLRSFDEKPEDGEFKKSSRYLKCSL